MKSKWEERKYKGKIFYVYYIGTAGRTQSPRYNVKYNDVIYDTIEMVKTKIRKELSESRLDDGKYWGINDKCETRRMK